MPQSYIRMLRERSPWSLSFSASQLPKVTWAPTSDPGGTCYACVWEEMVPPPGRPLKARQSHRPGSATFSGSSESKRGDVPLCSSAQGGDEEDKPWAQMRHSEALASSILAATSPAPVMLQCLPPSVTAPSLPLPQVGSSLSEDPGVIT